MQCTDKEIRCLENKRRPNEVRAANVTDVAHQVTWLMTSLALKGMPNAKSVGKWVILLVFASHLLHQ